MAILKFLGNVGKWLLDAGKKILQGMWDGLKIVWDLVKTWFGNFRTTVLGWLSTAVTWLVETGRNILDGMWNGLKIVWDFIKWWFFEFPMIIIGWLAGAANWLFSIGEDILKGLWDGMKRMAQRAWDWLSGWIGSLVSNAKRLLGISSPSKVFAGIGEDIGRGLLEGLIDMEDLVNAQIETMVEIPEVKPMAMVDTSANALAGQTVNYYAAPNQSFDAEQELLLAMRRVRILT